MIIALPAIFIARLLGKHGSNLEPILKIVFYWEEVASGVKDRIKKMRPGWEEVKDVSSRGKTALALELTRLAVGQKCLASTYPRDVFSHTSGTSPVPRGLV